jgi:AcrR family transcriptional regulator
VLASQRGRMLGAMADAVASKGYAATTVADVVAGAGVSRKTFY